MIKCDHDIVAALDEGRLLIDPRPALEQFASSAVDLRVGDDFHVWKRALAAAGTRHHVDLDRVNLRDLEDFMDPVVPTPDGTVVIPPGQLVLVRPLERVWFPLPGRLAARVEGRSKQARLGLTAHVTAPTVHCGFIGRITLEIINHGPFWLEVHPNHTRLCQLIIEEVSDVPEQGGSQTFAGQTTPLG